MNADKGLLWMFPHAIVNAMLIIILVLLTRAFHIDGLADTLDGLMGGYDSKSRLHIMKDSRLGTAGVIGIVLLLLVKYLALNNLFSGSKVEALLRRPCSPAGPRRSWSTRRATAGKRGWAALLSGTCAETT